MTGTPSIGVGLTGKNESVSPLTPATRPSPIFELSIAITPDRLLCTNNHKFYEINHSRSQTLFQQSFHYAGKGPHSHATRKCHHNTPRHPGRCTPATPANQRPGGI